MRPRRQPIPVWVHADEDVRRLLTKAGVELTCIELGKYESPAFQTELPPRTLVAILEAPSDKKHQSNSRRICIPQRRRVLGPRTYCLDDVIIEPFTPYFKRKFRKSKTGQVRLRDDLTTTKTRREGKPKKGCKRCARLHRGLSWRVVGRGKNRRVMRYNPYKELVGCSDHVRTISEEVPHPDAGQVIDVFSFERLLGQTPGTEIIVEIAGKWVRAEVQPYTWWTEREAAEKKRDKEREDQLQRQKFKNNVASRARARHRRYMAQPTRYELVMGDD